MRYINGWHPFEAIRFDLVKITSSSDLGATKSASTKTSLNWSHNGSKNYTVDSLSRYRCQRPLTNCHTADTARKDGGEMTLDLAIFPILLSIKWFQDVTNALFKRLAPL